MADNLRSKMIRLAASMPKGSSERKALLNVLTSTNTADFDRIYRELEQNLLRVGFRRGQQALSSGGSEDAFGSWQWGDRKTYIHVQISSAEGDPRGQFWVYFMAAQNNRVKERFEAKPKSMDGFRKAVSDALETAEEWAGSLSP